MGDTKNKKRSKDENEGEGSRTAARGYNEGVQRTLKKGRVTKDAEAARQEVERNPEEFRRAEEEGKSHSAGEAPGDLKATRRR